MPATDPQKYDTTKERKPRWSYSRRFTHRLDPVADAHDKLAVLLHLVDKLHGQHAAVEGLAELLGGGIQGTSKAVTL